MECRIRQGRVEPKLTEDVGYPFRVVMPATRVFQDTPGVCIIEQQLCASVNIGSRGHLLMTAEAHLENRSQHLSFFSLASQKSVCPLGQGCDIVFGLRVSSRETIGSVVVSKQLSGGIRQLGTAVHVGGFACGNFVSLEKKTQEQIVAVVEVF